MSRVVLIAEEEADLLEYLADLFRCRACTVHTAADYPSALRILNQHPLNLLIADMLLPQGGGFRLLEDFHAANSGGFSIMTSRTGSEEHRDYARSLGARAFLVKPISVEELMRIAVSHLRNYPVDDA